MSSVRDWQTHGVDLAVELATSGELIYGGITTLFPFDTGGAQGAPAGWYFIEYPNNGSATDYNVTTSNQICSVSTKIASRKASGIRSFEFPIKPGYRYQVGARARRMASYTNPAFRGLQMDRTKDNWATSSSMASIGSAYAQNDWEDISTTSSVVPAGYTMARIYVFGNSGDVNNATLYGVQWCDVYLIELAPDAEPLVWTDITCDVRSLGIRYGRERFTNRYDAGTLQVELNNDSGDYTYRVPHALNLRPGRQVRVVATYEGVSYPMAFGILDSITEGYSLDGHVISQWQCVDPTTILSNKNTATGVQVAMKSGKRIQQILEQAGYAYFQLDPGVFDVKKLEASGRTLRDEAGVTADSEGGSFFAERNGTIVYRDRTWRTRDEKLINVTADLLARSDEGDLPIVDEIPTLPNAPTICLSELKTDWSLARVMNIVSLANAGGTAQTFTDEASIKSYGPHSYERMDFVLNGDSYLATRAADLMNGYAEPVLRVTSLAFAPGINGEWEYALSVFLNWMVRIWYRNEPNDWGYAVAIHVQSVEHRITHNDWSTVMAVDVPEAFTEVFNSDYGWDMGLWDVALWDQVAPAGALWSDPESTWSTAGDNWGE